MEQPNNPNNESWEQKTLRELAFASIKEQRSRRRWGYVFKGLFLLVVVASIIINMKSSKVESEATSHTAMVDIQGVIAADADANADTIVKGIREAFKNKSAKGLILNINSPGGSPVQAGIINDEIHRLKKQRPDFPVYAVISDVGASGAYYIAVAADKIYADKASIVGSIGVRMDGFGFSSLINKVGIERRSLTAGSHKAFLDPFLPLKPEEVAMAHKLLENIHQQFITVVKQGRGDRLAKNNPNLFSGLFWSGQQALKLGLIDGLADKTTVANMIGAKHIVDYTPRPDYFNRFAKKLGTSIAQTLSAQTHWKLQ